MPPGSALRIKCELPNLHTNSATISGTILARYVRPPPPPRRPSPDDDEDGAEEAGETGEAEDDEEEDEGELVELLIAPLGASSTGLPVPVYKPLSFLEAIGPPDSAETAGARE